jgi:hypothetical protein
MTNDEWHVPASTLRAYTEERLADSDAWSVEAHVVECVHCRHMIGKAAEVGEASAIVQQVRFNLSGDLPPQGRIRPPGRWRRSWILLAAAPALRGAWLVAVLFALASTIGLDLISDGGRELFSEDNAFPWWTQHGSMLLLVAPILPALGVAMCYGPAGDPAHEITASTASGGLRLVLWRTLSVLLTTVPAAAMLGMASGRTSIATWLLPCVALTCLTLALGSALRLEVAGTSVAAGWLILVWAPLLVRRAPILLDPSLPAVWSAMIAISLIVLVTRRSTYRRASLTSKRS